MILFKEMNDNDDNGIDKTEWDGWFVGHMGYEAGSTENDMDGKLTKEEFETLGGGSEWFSKIKAAGTAVEKSEDDAYVTFPELLAWSKTADKNNNNQLDRQEFKDAS